MNVPIKKKTWSLIALSCAATAFVAAPTAAQAACPPVPTAPYFSAFGDANDYSQVPGGGFEPGTPAWTVSSAATLLNENEPFLAASGGTKSLRLPAGSTATSPPFCVSDEHPTLRLFGRMPTGTVGRLRVDLVYTDNGQAATTSSGAIVNVAFKFRNWAPSDPLPLATNLPASFINRGGDSVQLQITPESGTWQIDDVFYDPRASR